MSTNTRRASVSDVVPLHRHWSLLRMLGARRHGMTVSEMAREMGVADKTIRRDLDLFRRVCFPVEETDSARGEDVAAPEVCRAGHARSARQRWLRVTGPAAIRGNDRARRSALWRSDKSGLVQ
jgi:hypothetical protein